MEPSSRVAAVSLTCTVELERKVFADVAAEGVQQELATFVEGLGVEAERTTEMYGPQGGMLRFGPDAFGAFLSDVKQGAYDRERL